MKKSGTADEAGLAWLASGRTRIVLLALLLENVGADAAVRLGNPEIWREAVRHLG